MPQDIVKQQAVLEIKHFSKSYSKTKRAVDDLSLEVSAGDIFGFIGQNGAGKTTTLRAVTGVKEKFLSQGDPSRRIPSHANRSRRTFPTTPTFTIF